MSDKTENQFKQEPIAWMYEKQAKDEFSQLTLSFDYEPDFEGIIRPLFVESELKRKPLSDDDLNTIIKSIDLYLPLKSAKILFAIEIEKALGIGE